MKLPRESDFNQMESLHAVQNEALVSINAPHPAPDSHKRSDDAYEASI
jgi:hypothetical protein